MGGAPGQGRPFVDRDSAASNRLDGEDRCATDRLLEWTEVQRIAGISRSTAWRMQQTGDFPSPVPVSPNRVGWVESELADWTAKRKAGGRARPSPFVPPRAPRLIQTARIPKPRVESAAKPTARKPSSDARSAQSGPVQTCLPLEAALKSSAKPPRKPRRRPVSPDQTDFGF